MAKTDGPIVFADAGLSPIDFITKTAARVFCVDRKAQKKSVESLVNSSQPVTVLFEKYSNYS